MRLGLILRGALVVSLLALAGSASAERAKPGWDLDETPYEKMSMAGKIGNNVRTGTVELFDSFGQLLFGGGRAIWGLGQKTMTLTGDVVALVDGNEWIYTDRVFNSILSRHLLRFGSGHRNMVDRIGDFHDTSFDAPAPGMEQYIDNAPFHTEAYVANSTLGTLGALIVGNGLVRPAGSLCTIFGMRKTGEQLNEWSMDLIQEGMRMRFP